MKKLIKLSILLFVLSSCEKDNIELLKHPEVKDRVQTDTIDKVINI